MLNNVITNINSILTIPESNEIAIWERFFNALQKIDKLSPLYVLIHYSALLYDFDIEEFEIPCFGYYYDVAIEMAADDRYPAYDAAVNTGFFNKGMIMAAYIAATKENNLQKLVNAVEKMFGYEKEMEDLTATPSVVENSSNIRNNGVEKWEKLLEGAMKKDPNASVSILRYYIEAIVGGEWSIFCPLGCDEYKEIGKAMSENDAAFEAAKDTGLLADACDVYITAALDNDCNWYCLRKGVALLLSDPKTRCFVTCRKRVAAEKMIAADAVLELNEELWDLLAGALYDDFGDELQGY